MINSFAKLFPVLLMTGGFAASAFGSSVVTETPFCTAVAADCRPETWFHIIGGNASKEGLAADIAAIAEAGIGGIQFFHGGWEKDEPWPGVTEMIPCLSPKWAELVKFASEECHRRGLTFKMQNCPGWSMSGGPWITPDKAMRRLVAFEPGKKPAFDDADDYQEIGTVTFPTPGVAPDAITTVTFPNPQRLNHHWAYEPDAELALVVDGREVFRRDCPQGAWQDNAGMTFTLPEPVAVRPGAEIRGEVRSPHGGTRAVAVTTGNRRGMLDNWEAKAGWALRGFTMSTNAAPVAATDTLTLVFGHVNAKRKNAPAPKEGTGWECDKMDARGFEANWTGYLGRLVQSGVKIDGTLVDSWECGCQTWTGRMEEEFAKRTGYALRPWLPALFGHVLQSEAATEKFLLDWRNVCSCLVEENYYGVMARLARENGMTIQFETAFGDVIPGDILRFWKDADEPMCEFWHPHDDAKGFVGSHNFKPVLPCVSAAHIYGKKRVSAEALTSFELTFDENFSKWKKTIDRHLARGVTHIVFHTFTHNPVVDGKPPSTSFGAGIGSPFLRGQTWWPYLKEFSAYLEFCGRELERGLPVVDILMYLGDDVNHKPLERELLFTNRYKYDYLNHDALMTRVAVKDGRLVFPDGFSCRVLWIPDGTVLLSATERKLAELEQQGARVVRGAFTPDWPSPVGPILDSWPRPVHWTQRRDGDETIFFIASEGRSLFVSFTGDSLATALKEGRIKAVDPVTRKQPTGPIFVYPHGYPRNTPLELKPLADYPVWATTRVYTGTVTLEKDFGEQELRLGKVRDWATVWVNGQEAARLWCEPFVCDITSFVKEGVNEIKVEVTSTWYNALVHDAKLPEAERTTWTLHGPKADAPYHDAGLLGPVTLHSAGPRN